MGSLDKAELIPSFFGCLREVRHSSDLVKSHDWRVVKREALMPATISLQANGQSFET